MIKFDDEEIQMLFDKCHFRQVVGEVDICRGMCTPCERTIEMGQCVMLTDYFSKQKGEKG